MKIYVSFYPDRDGAGARFGWRPYAANSSEPSTGDGCRAVCIEVSDEALKAALDVQSVSGEIGP